jgi:alanine racemase
MVKAGAYGLGAVPVAGALETLDPWGYGVATVEEGVELRAAGVSRPLLVFTPAVRSLREAFRQHDLRAVIDHPEVAAGWDGPYHVEIDTGMGRCGVRWDAADTLTRFASPYLEGAFTHFYAADQGPQTVWRQWERFEQALAALGSRPPLVHAANSAAAFRLLPPLDLVRPGIFLYGGRAGTDLPTPVPVVAVRAPVVSLRDLPVGATVSYGGDWTAKRPTRIATLGIGYADGVLRAAQDHAEVLLGGARRQVVGRITMDFLMVDLGDRGAAEIEVGDTATLIGNDGDHEITVDEAAGWAGTISYEILTRLGPRLPREYRGP